MSSCDNGGAASHAEAVYGGIGQQMRNPITGGINETAISGTYVGGKSQRKKGSSRLYKPWYTEKKDEMMDNYYLEEKERKRATKRGKKRGTKRKSKSGLAFFRNIMRRNKTRGKRRRMRGGNCGCSSSSTDTSSQNPPKIMGSGDGYQQLEVGSLL